MSRLTNSEKAKYYNDRLREDYCLDDDTLRYAKLGKYEDIEDELGVDLIILFKALKNGCFAKETFNYMGKSQTQIIFTNFTYLYYADDIGAYFIHIRTKDYYLNDYGKTWALDKNDLIKEELEK